MLRDFNLNVIDTILPYPRPVLATTRGRFSDSITAKGLCAGRVFEAVLSRVTSMWTRTEIIYSFTGFPFNNYYNYKAAAAARGTRVMIEFQ